jgi:DNA-3-methyladenine glycosylase I
MEEIEKTRCFGGNDDLLMMHYHDDEWGVPVHDDRLLFEFLALEGAQAGLSWQTILRKRGNFREAFHDFDAAKVAAYGEADKHRLLVDAGIVRNRLKIVAIINNARRLLEVQKEFGSFDRYIWQFTGYKTLRRPGTLTFENMPAKTAESEAMSRNLKKRGFRFVGPTICYAFMQAIGMVNDHITACFRAPRL